MEATPEPAGRPAPRRRPFPLRRHRMQRRDFERAYRTGSRARGSHLTVVVCENGLDVTRLGLSVGKRCSKSAVRRNRVRRIYREAFRLSLEELPAGLDVVLIAPPAEPDLRLDETRRELLKMTRKALGRYREKRTEERT